MNCNLNNANSKIIALGFFDGLHLGHRTLLNELFRPCYIKLESCVFTFKLTSQLDLINKRKLIITYEEKFKSLKEIGIKSIISPNFDDFRNMSPYEFVNEILHKQLNAKVVICGGNFKFGKNASGNVETLNGLCKFFKIKLIIKPLLKVNGQVVSSTLIRKLIKDKQFSEAEKLLGKRIERKT